MGTHMFVATATVLNWHMGQPHKLYASTNPYLFVMFLKIPHCVTYRWIEQINTVLTPTKNNSFFNAWVSDQNSVFGDNCESVILDCTCRLEFVFRKVKVKRGLTLQLK